MREVAGIQRFMKLKHPKIYNKWLESGEFNQKAYDPELDQLHWILENKGGY